jgi:general secretion pathway protein I
MLSDSRPSTARNYGFTLIEVLVALSIVVVSFVALYSGLLQIVSGTTLMQEKTLATWIAYDRITELRIAEEYPEVGESEGEIEMGRLNWRYVSEIRATASDDIRQVIVRVAPESEPENYLGIASGALIRKGSRSPLGQLPGNDPNDPNNPGNDPNNPGNPDDGSEAGGIEE